MERMAPNSPADRRQIEIACQMAAEFEAHPEAVSDAELQSKCLPSWVAGEIDLSPALLRALQRPPPLWLRAKPGTGGQVASALGDCLIFGTGALSDTLQYRGKKDLFRTTEFRAGKFELQDIASQGVGLVCDPKPREKWWDACAGEGGKLLHLSDLMQNKGFVLGSDRAEWRLNLLKRRAARARVFNYKTAHWDGEERLPARTLFDGVLVDAPCSGSGTWQRNPHARWTTTPRDVRELSTLQLRLLRRACKALKPGGKLVYAVCTLTTSETSSVAKGFEESGDDFKRVQISSPLNKKSTPAEELYLYPQEHGGNGMYVAVWIRQPRR